MDFLSVVITSSSQKRAEEPFVDSWGFWFAQQLRKGINGYETYKRIIEIYPNQKAIIASGFSETSELKKAKKLGAGMYIKKPYTIEKIGVAVKEELQI